MAFMKSSVDCAEGSRIKNFGVTLILDEVIGIAIFNPFVVFALFAILSVHDSWNQLQGKVRDIG
jgi:hypothetical protein